jgi:hypothetical protein
MPAMDAAAFYAEAETTADELMAHRPSFFIELLENCSPSCPVTNQEKLKAAIKSARERNEKIKRSL